MTTWQEDYERAANDRLFAAVRVVGYSRSMIKSERGLDALARQSLSKMIAEYDAAHARCCAAYESPIAQADVAAAPEARR